MSYNPTRHGDVPIQRKQRYVDPKSGRRHSQIVANNGLQGVALSDIPNRVTTSSGWKIPYFVGDEFEMIYEYICSKNSTGIIKNETQDRAIRVLNGQVFITIDGNINRINTNQGFSITKGTTYELATSGTGDAEILFCQGSNYETHIERLSDSLTNLNSVPITLPLAAPIRQARPESKAAEQAEALSNAKEIKRRQRQPAPRVDGEQREGARAPLPGQTVTGYSPQPSRGQGFDDE